MEKEYKIKLAKITDQFTSWLFIVPVIVGILVFSLVPMISSLVYSFTEYNTTVSSTYQAWVGFANYIEIFTTRWEELGQALSTTAIYTIISVPLNLVLSFALALLLSKDIKGIKVIRMLMYAPVLIPTIVSGLLWKDLTATNGAFNIILNSLGVAKYSFFNSNDTAMFSFILMGLFTLGGSMILWIAQIKAIPDSMYEVAKIEGAHYPTVLFKIVIPLCTPMIFYNLVLTIVNSLQVCATALPVITYLNSDALGFYVYQIYYTINDASNLGLGCAMSWLLFLVIALITAITFRFNKWVYYEEEA